MLRLPITERPGWRDQAKEFGFHFHTLYGETYWDESAYYQFTLAQIERDLEAPTAEIQQMCLAVVDKVVNSERLLEQFQIPQPYHDALRQSWLDQDPSLYSRLDFAYDGKSPAKLLENNADTPTSLYETGFWQWLWLEQQVQSGHLRRDHDQFNSLQEKLVNRFYQLALEQPGKRLHFSCCKDNEEDRGTVQYLEDCAIEAGIDTAFVYIEDIGEGEGRNFTDLDNQVIEWLFKLYPWEFMLREASAPLIPDAPTQWLEPLWKSVLSNKALLPALWQQFPNHPNLLPAYFSEHEARQHLDDYVRKPLFSREGANISRINKGSTLCCSEGPYGDEGYIYQAFHALPQFGQNHTLIGSWLVGNEPAGISVREDRSWITQDMSRYLPHVIIS